MILFIKLLLAHFIGDFVIQPNSWVKDKNEKKVKSLKLYLHVIIHMGLTMLILFDSTQYPIIFFVGFSHYVIDLCKASAQNKENKRLTFIIDQIMHLIVIAVISNYYEPILNIVGMIEYGNQIILIVLALIILIPVSSKSIKVLISKWSPETEEESEDSLEDAGQYIGILERLFVFGFVVSGQIQAVGFLLAAKSVFRFGDLKDPKDRKLTEYILIGTLISFGSAILVGYAYLFLKMKI